MDSTNSTSHNEHGLVYCRREYLAPKDFGAEIRGQMDIEQFAHQAELLIDPQLDEANLSDGRRVVEEIIGRMLEQVSRIKSLGKSLTKVSQLTHAKHSSGGRE